MVLDKRWLIFSCRFCTSVLGADLQRSIAEAGIVESSLTACRADRPETYCHYNHRKSMYYRYDSMVCRSRLAGCGPCRGARVELLTHPDRTGTRWRACCDTCMQRTQHAFESLGCTWFQFDRAALRGLIREAGCYNAGHCVRQQGCDNPFCPNWTHSVALCAPCSCWL